MNAEVVDLQSRNQIIITWEPVNNNGGADVMGFLLLCTEENQATHSIESDEPKRLPGNWTRYILDIQRKSNTKYR